jgi:hypothetical protein
MVEHAYNPNIKEANAGGSQFPVQPLLQSKTLSKKKKREKKR